MRRAIRVAGWSFIWTGLFLLGFVGFQLYGTDLLTARAQESARLELAEVLEQRRLAAPPPTPVEVEPPVSTLPGDDSGVEEPAQAEAVLYREEPAPQGEPVASMRIPDLGLEAVVFEGVDTATLRQGPGHMPWTPLPGQPGNAVISGHRTTYGRPFFDLDQLEPGDAIEVETAIGLHTYEVREVFVVEPTDVWVTDPRPGAWLTLTTCHPKFSARERLIVTAELVEGPNLEYALAVAQEVEAQ